MIKNTFLDVKNFFPSNVKEKNFLQLTNANTLPITKNTFKNQIQ